MVETILLNDNTLPVILSTYLLIHLPTNAMYLYITSSLKEVQRNVHKKPHFILIILRRIYIVMYKHSVYRLKKNINVEQCSNFYFFSYAREKEKEENSSITPKKQRSDRSNLVITCYRDSCCGNYQSQYSSFCTIPCFFLQSGQYHLPLGGTIIPTHSKWNHSMRQSSPSQAIISDTSSYGHRQ